MNIANVSFPRTRVFAFVTSIVCACFAPGAHATDTDSVLPNGNTADGSGVLISLTSGVWNTGIGFQALNQDTSGSSNTAEGVRALFSNTNGNNNTATGAYALYLNSSGAFNAAFGTNALQNNIGSFNTAFGASALFKNSSADGNTAMGYGALTANTTGGTPAGSSLFESGPNTAVGAFALTKSTNSGSNVAVGYSALRNLTLGASFANNVGGNTAVGFKALANTDTSGANLPGNFNTAIGHEALVSNTLGANNTAVGVGALSANISGTQNAAVGDRALFTLSSGSNNTAVGAAAGANITGTGNVDIGDNVQGFAGESNTTRIRNIYETTIAAGATVVVDSSDRLGKASSSRRYKEDIQSMNDSSDELFQLRPVRYYPKGATAPNRPKCYGLIAEEVAEINHDLVLFNREGQPESVRYDCVNAMLLNEFLKEHQRLQKLSASDLEQKKAIAALQRQLREQAEAIRQVSERIELNAPSRQLTANQQ